MERAGLASGLRRPSRGHPGDHRPHRQLLQRTPNALDPTAVPL